MTIESDPYQTIAEMWTFPESLSFRKMLEALMSRDDAELLLEARTPVTPAQLAKRLDLDEASVAARLENLAKRGLIFRGKTEYCFRRGVHFGFAGPPASKEYAPSAEYQHWRKVWSDENPDREVKGWLERYQQT